MESQFIDRQFIGGEFITGKGERDQITDPTSGGVLAELVNADLEQVDAAVTAAARAQKNWGAKTPLERSQCLLSIADRLEQEFSAIAEVESRNTGKLATTVSRDECHHIVDPFRFFAGAVRTQTGLLGGEYVQGCTSQIRREPIGVSGLIIPWNYPMMMACWKIAPALAAGNAIVAKPSELTPFSLLKFAELVRDILPAGVFNVVTGRGANVGNALVKDSRIRLVSLTGGIETGTKVAVEATKDLKRVHLELGGKAPVLVFSDADLEAAAKGVAAAGYYNAGQDCTAACRVFVQKDVHETFKKLLLNEVSHIRTGQPHDPEQTYGPLISENHRDKVHGFVQRAKEKGTPVLCGGTLPDTPGYFYPPTILDQVPFANECVQHEIFGPVVTITTFDSEEQVLNWSNDTDYGLAASVWTSSLDCASRCSQALEYGCVWVNTHLLWPTEMPHGGYKRSGLGKEMSVYGLEDYQQVKHVMICQQ